MSVLIFRLRHVPDDEAEAIRVLLDKNAIDWYETTAGNWGISMPGIWVNSDAQTDTARELIERYQHERVIEQRELHEQRTRQGRNVSLVQRVLQHPLRSMGIVAFCVFILYVSIHPFMQMIAFSKQ